MELGYHIYVLATQSPDVEETKPLLYATVLVLLALTFLLNAAAIGIRARFRQSRAPRTLDATPQRSPGGRPSSRPGTVEGRPVGHVEFEHQRLPRLGAPS